MTNHVNLSMQNYAPFYFVYALLRGPWKARVFHGRRVLAVHGATGEKRTRILAGLEREGVSEVHWLAISAERSLFDQIDCLPWRGRIDLCVVGAGIGKPNILLQLRELQVPCIDAGYVFEVWANPVTALSRAYMTPDADPASARLDFLNRTERKLLRKND